ncbi:hypothetical protein [Helicobacter mastomyrinus]|mgnify:FL=1|uniref:Ferrochelatase n=3 Tax=Helicobacter TaxID=209 RepID=A0ABZ3F2S9_9HELI|nr:hypothetical protein [uncultured Helicobacter sp.]
MRVNEVVEITKGVLLNTPSIAMFSRIICHLEKIEKGDLYIALDEEATSYHITQAIQAGAYGVICEKNIKIDDEEIAYIQVENIQDCLMRLIRYKLLVKNVALIDSLSIIEESIAKNIIDDEKVCFFEGDLSLFVESLNNETISLVITHNKQITDLGFNILQVSKPKERPFLVLSHTLFDSTILYEGTHCRINLPKLFFNELSAVLHLCQQENISYSLQHFRQIPFFKPNFLNAFGKIIEYGQASKVAIAEEDIEHFKRYMAYIANNAAWGKILFLVPQVYLELFNQIAQTRSYATQEQLCEHIHRENFNFALVLGINDDTLVDALNNNYKPFIEPDLFSGVWNEEPQQQLL